MLPEKLPLSVAIITKNEEGNLPYCLRSISFADEIVVDTINSERTMYAIPSLLALTGKWVRYYGISASRT